MQGIAGKGAAAQRQEKEEGGEEGCEERAFCKDSGQEEAWQEQDTIARENTLSLVWKDWPAV